jgi:hypothetical protein
MDVEVRMERVHMNDVIEILHRLRQGESVQAIHRDTGHARKTIRKYREIASLHGFLDAGRPLPGVEELFGVLGTAKRPHQNNSTLEPYGSVVRDNLECGMTMKLIWCQFPPHIPPPSCGQSTPPVFT